MNESYLPDVLRMTDEDVRRVVAYTGHFHRDDEPPLPPEMIGCECTGRFFVRRDPFPPEPDEPTA